MAAPNQVGPALQRVLGVNQGQFPSVISSRVRVLRVGAYCRRPTGSGTHARPVPEDCRCDSSLHQLNPLLACATEHLVNDREQLGFSRRVTDGVPSSNRVNLPVER